MVIGGLSFSGIFMSMCKGLGILFLAALRADAMAELGPGVVTHVYFHLMPVASVVADLFAPCANGY
jgi:hypothetical protein